MSKISFIIATKDRPDDLRKMLGSLNSQSVHPDQIIIVDASENKLQDVLGEFPSLNIHHTHHSPPSAAKQRNAGLAAVQVDVDLIGFLDDDVVLEPNAIENMLVFWRSAPSDFGGAVFNWLNPPKRSMLGLKKLHLTSWLGIYPAQIGGVALSGWQGAVGTVDRDTCVQWLPSGASVWRREVFSCGGFDDHFEGYSYLEDLDFSYGVGRRSRLCILADAGFLHYPAAAGRCGKYDFGKTEVENRLYFVHKHHLSMWRCYVGVLIRLFMTIAGGGWARATGNIVGFIRSFKVRRIIEKVGYSPHLISITRLLRLSGAMRWIYYALAKPKDGILKISVAGLESRFHVHTPEELRILESIGGGEETVLRELMARLPRGATVYDVGANVGLYTMFLAKSVGANGRVIAFEPQTQNHKHLEENVLLNGLRNVTTVRKALGNSNSIGRLNRGDIIGNYSLVAPSFPSNTSEDVNIVSGDECAFDNELPIPYLVKIDVEGFEMSVVQGLRETLCNPGCRIVCIEIHAYLLPKVVSAQNVIDALEFAGFRVITRHDRKRDFHLIMAKPQQLCLAA